MIGIRLADHSVFPVFTSDAPGRKRVVLTTARDDQERVDIELVQSDNYDVAGSRPLTIGQVTLDDLQPGRGGEAEVDLVLRLTQEGNLDVSATNRASGNERSVSINVHQAIAEAEYSVPESLTEEFAPQSAAEIHETPRSRRSGWLLILAIILILALLTGGAWWFFLRSPVDDTSGGIPATETGGEATSPAEEVPDPPVVIAEDQPAPASSAPSVEESTPTDVVVDSDTVVDDDSVEYRIRRGDTLWDISQTFYGTPWLFSELADANEISNPNLIYAESELEIPEQLLRRDE